MEGALIAGAGASFYGAYQSSQQADKMTELAQQQLGVQQQLGQQQLQLGRDQLAFNQRQYDMWNQTFGDTQRHLAEYFNNLNPAEFEARGLQNIESAYASAQKRLTENLASRGIQGSGIEAAGAAQIESGRAQAVARNPFETEQQIQQMRQGFLGAGLGQQSQAVSGINQSFGTQTQAVGNQMQLSQGAQQFYLGQANVSGQSAAGFSNLGANLLGYASTI